jgi:hypothetical protein
MDAEKVRPIRNTLNRDLTREMAEVPKELVEEFAREFLRLKPGARVFQTQLEMVIEEINFGRADFIEWVLRIRPDQLPDCSQTVADFVQRVSPEVVEAIADLPREVEVDAWQVELFARETLGIPDDSELSAAQLEVVIEGIANARYDFRSWVEARAGEETAAHT